MDKSSKYFFIMKLIGDYLNNPNFLTEDYEFFDALINEIVIAYDKEIESTDYHTATQYDVDGYVATMDTRALLSKYYPILAPYKRIRTVSQNDAK